MNLHKLIPKILFRARRTLKPDFKNISSKVASRFIPSKAASLCKGAGIEIGAMCSPAKLPNANSIAYADIGTAEEMRQSISDLGYSGYQGWYPKVDIIFAPDAPPLKLVPSGSIDFVYSSHSLEHSPNPIAALCDYLRVVKKGGIVFTIIPNKRFTYDRLREVTPLSRLVYKYHQDIWRYTLEEYRDVFFSTADNHEVYTGKTEMDVIDAWKSDSLHHKGHHHIHVFDENLLMSLVEYVCGEIDARLVYLECSGIDISFALEKK